jgi:predicted DNA-binding transcriptional regulator YafY
MTVLPAATDAIVAALFDRQPVAVAYHGRSRVVCPHAIGCKNGRIILLAYQSGGETSTGDLPADPARRWRCLYIDEIETVAEDDSDWQSPANYDPARPFPAADAVAVAV